MDRYGFPRTKAKGASRVQGFKTGDMVKAVVPSGKPKSTHVGKVVVKARGLFTVAGIPDVPARYCRVLQRADGYVYATGVSLAMPLATHSTCVGRLQRRARITFRGHWYGCSSGASPTVHR
jgi:hypothetical protein